MKDSDHKMNLTNWFEQDGQDYAKFRPEYPAELSTYLASISPNNSLAVDVGCGNGQFTKQLADHFSNVVGIDPSQEQINNAKPRDNIKYICAPSEQIPLENNSASLITAAQAAHWFNLPDFYKEARRIAVKDATIALISYGVLCLPDELNARFLDFYYREIGPFWPAERKLVDDGYSSINFSFESIKSPLMTIELDWNLESFLGYISTWSAVKKAQKVDRQDIAQNFANDLAKIWGDPNSKHTVTWPINTRIGKIRIAK